MIDIFNAKDLYITSDLHLFHTNIIKYCDRPFVDVKEMNEHIIEQFNELPKNSIVWILGDVAFGSFKHKYSDYGKVRQCIDLMRKNNKTLVLLLGNHDKDFYKLFKEEFNDNITLYKDLGFDYVYNRPILFNDNTIFSHEPVYIKPGSNFKNIHGHIHNAKMTEDYFALKIENYDMRIVAGQKEGIKDLPPREKVNDKVINLKDYRNVSIDATEYKILDLRKIL